MRALLFLLIAACGGERFGKIITEVSPSPQDPRLLLVRSCELIATGKSNVEGVKLGDCKRYGVRRSPIVPVPVTEGRVLAREDRIVTGFAERPGGGAVVTTCRIGQRDTRWALLDCVETAIATAPLEAGTPPSGSPAPTAPLTPAGPPAPAPAAPGAP